MRHDKATGLSNKGFELLEKMQKAQEKEAWILRHMSAYNVGRERAEKKYRQMKRHGLA